MTITSFSGRLRGNLRAWLDAARVQREASAVVRDTSRSLPDDLRPASQSLPKLADPEKLRFAGMAFLAVGALALGFVVQFAAVSQISYVRDQQLAHDAFRYELANATAPVGQVGQDAKLLALGTPVSLLSVPAIGLTAVVGEGTTSAVTRSGPGHRRDTPLPGQAGASVIYGRQTAYGAPFASISTLVPGDVITATTGQGVAKYTVTDVRYTGDPVPAPISAGGGRLTLVTGSGIPFLPQSIVRVDATLTTPATASPGRVLGFAALDDSELTMAGDASAWPLLVLAVIMLAGGAVLFTVSRRLWGRWQTWVVAVPVFLAVGLFAAGQVAILLPNLM